MKRTQTATFTRDNREYRVTITETRGIAPYKIDVESDGDELHLDSDFKKWSDDIWSEFESIIETDKFQIDIINSCWWEYNA